MCAVDLVMANVDAVHASGGLQSNGDKIVNDRGRVQSSTRKSASKITKKRAQKKKAPPIGSARDFPCRPCVTRATKNPGHECASQDNTGAACWDCAKNGHTCRPAGGLRLAGGLLCSPDGLRIASLTIAQELETSSGKLCAKRVTSAEFGPPKLAGRVCRESRLETKCEGDHVGDSTISMQMQEKSAS
ncbi:hypothetical protein B0T10DRAFT_553417 [Thelonectria olida]|uniref:Uncharacterized protein n=1 Tax=Thelonectria olida TaxID=1576542 RepID=A0A9P8VPT9_9HYPO|nr:hypothetical protein B0T10DRAFT_553417 [Thelonectria olida]